MGKRSLELHEETFSCDDPLFGDLDDESQRTVLSALGLAGLNPKARITFHRDGPENARLGFRLPISKEPSDQFCGVGETMYSKQCPA